MTRLRSPALLLSVLALSGCGYVIGAGAAALVGTQRSRSGGVVVLFDEDADLVVSRGPQDPVDSTEGKGVSIVAAQFRFTPTKDTTLESLVFTAAGTGNDAAIGQVRLVHDQDSDGLVGAGEPSLGATTTFSGDNGSAVFVGLNETIAAGTSLDVLVVMDLPADAIDQDTFQVSIAENGIEATTLLNGAETRRVNIFGAPLSGSTKTISSTATMTVRLGPAAPPNATVFPNAPNVPLLQLDLRTSTAEPVRVDELRLKTSGTGNEPLDIGRADLYLDVDSDGTLDLATDQAIVLGVVPTTDNGDLVLSGLGQTIQAGGVVRWLLVYTLSGTANDGSTFRVDLQQGSDVVVQGLTSVQTIVPTGPPVNLGATLTVTRASLDVTKGPINPARTATPSATFVPALQIQLAAGPAEPVLVSSIAFNGVGGGDESTDLGAVRLYHDQNGNGVLDGGEPQIASPTAYSTNNGSVTFSGFSKEIAAGVTEQWLVTYDISATAVGNDQFRADIGSVGSITTVGKGSLLQLTPTVGTINGGLLTVTGSLVSVAGGSQPGVPNQPFSNNADVPVTQLTVGAGAGEPIRLTSVVVAPSGTGNDQLGITAVDLIQDNDDSGTFSGPDAILQSLTYPADNAAVTFSNPAGLTTADIAPTTSVNLLIRYRLSGSALQGQTFIAQVNNAAMLGEGTLSGLPIQVGGAAVGNSGNPVTTQRARLTFAVGPENPGVSDILNGQTNLPILQLEVVAGPGEPVNLGAITFRSSGSANEPAVVSQARLYLEGAGTRGVVDGTDTQLGAGQVFSGNDGFVTFSGAPLTNLPAGSTRYLLLVYDIAGAAPAPGTLTARLDAAPDVTGTGTLSAPALSAEILGAPIVGSQKTIRNGTLAAAAGLQNPAAANTFPNSTGVEVLQVQLTAGFAEGVTVQSVRLTAAGSDDESTAVSALRLYKDTNGDGLVTGGVDTLLGTTATVPNNGTVTFPIAAGDVEIPAGATTNLLAVYDLSAAATPAANLRMRIANPAADIAAVGSSSAQAIVPSGGAVEGNAQTIVLGSLTASVLGTNPGDSTELPNASGVAMLQVHLVAGATESVAITTMTVTHQGSGNPQTGLTETRLYHDSNGNGLLDADTLLATTTFSGGTATFSLSPGTFSLAESASADLLVVHIFNGAAANGDQFRVRLAADADLTGRGNSSSVTITPTGISPGGLQGGLKTIETASLTIAQGDNNPAAATFLRNEAGVEVTQVKLTAGGAEAVRITSMTFTAAGALDVNAHVAQIRIYREQDPPNGVLDGDALIGTFAGGFGAGSRTFTLGAGDLEVPAGGSKSVLVVLDMNVPAGQAGNGLAVQVANNADVTAVGVISSLTVTPTGAPAPGNTHTVSEGGLTLATGPNPPVNSDIATVQSDNAILQMQLSAGAAEAVRVGSIRIQASGTGNPLTGVTQVRLFRDDNVNGVLDGDQFLGGGTFSGPGNDITIPITAGQLDIAATSSRSVLVVYDIGGSAADGQTFSGTIPNNAAVVATGVTSGLSITTSGAPVNGATKTTRAVSLTVREGVPPPNAPVLSNASAVRALHLDLVTGPVDGVRLTQLTVRTTGTADDTNVRARLFHDTNRNGTLEGGEAQIGSQTFAANEGAVTFNLNAGDLDIPVGQTRSVLVVYDLPGTSPGGLTYQARLDGTGDVAGTALSSPVTAVVSGPAFPVNGATLTVQSTTLDQDVPTPQSPAGNVFPNAQDVVMSRIRYTAGALEGVRITELQVRPTTNATGPDTSATVELYRDVNTNGTLELGTDTLLATRSGNDIAVVITASGGLIDIPAGQSRQLLVVYDLGAPLPAAGDQFEVELRAADVVAEGLGSGAPIATVGGATVTGGLKTIFTEGLALSDGPNNTAGGTVYGNQVKVMQQVRLTASVGAVRIDQYDVRHTGDGTPATDVAEVRLYRDDNGNGLLDGDTLLATGTFAGSVAAVTTTGGVLTVPNGTPTDVLVVYQFNTAAANNETFAADRLQPGDLTAVGTTSTGSVAPVGSAAPGGTQIFRLGQLAFTDGPAPPPAGPAYRNQTRVPVQQITFTAQNEPMRLDTLTVTKTGTGAMAGLAQARLYQDLDQDGLIDPSDLQIDARAFSGTNVTFSQAGGLASVASGTSITLLVAYDFTAAGNGGDTYGADAVAPADVTATGLTSTLTSNGNGAAAASNALTVTVGTLALQVGPANPGAGSVGTTQSGVAVQQVTATAAGESVHIDTLRIGRAGTGTDGGVALVRVFRDVNNNGVLDGDAFLGSGTFTASVAAIGTSNLITVNPGTPVNLLVVYDLSASVGESYGADQLDPADVDATGATSGNTLTVTGNGPAGGLQSIAALPVVDVSQTVLGGADVAPLQTGVVALQLQLTETSNLDAARLKALNVTASGTALDQNAVKFVWLYVNNAPVTSAVGPEDVQIGLTTYFADNGVAAFAGLNQLVPQNGVLNLLVTYDLEDATQMAENQTLIASIQSGDVTVESDAGGTPITPGGTFPITGRTLTVAGKLTVGPGPDNLSGTVQLRGGTKDERMLQLSLTAEIATVTVTALEIQAAGTGDDPSGIAAATLYRDVNKDGLIDGGDVVIRTVSNPFALNDGPATFGGLSEDISPGTSVRWLVTYDIAAVNTVNHTYRTSLLDVSKVSVSSGVVVGSGLPATGITVQILGGVTLALGPANPTGVVLNTPDPGKEVLQLALTADAAEDMSVNSITLTATGTADDTNSYTQTRLYLDSNNNNVFEPGAPDAQIDVGKVFATNNGSLTFTFGAPEALPKGTTKTVWYAVDVAGDPPAVPGATFRMRVAQNADVSVTAAISTSTLVSGAAVDGQTFRTGTTVINLFGPGTGTRLLNHFTTATTTPDLEAADFDRDGDVDILGLRGTAAFELLLADGTGSFPTRSGDIATVNARIPRRAAIGDIDNDGDIDIVLVTATAVQRYLNNGSGGFAAGGAELEQNAANDYRDVALIDFDRDGDLDIVATRTVGAANEIARLRNDGGGAFTALTAVSLLSPPRDLAVGDINNDGIDDVALSDDGSNVRVYTGDGATNFSLFSTASNPTQTRDLVVGAFSNDCFDDVVVVDETSAQWYSFLGSGTGITSSNNAPTNGGDAGITGPKHMVSGDFDRDGRLDVAIAHDGGDGLVGHVGDNLGNFPGASTHQLPNPALNPDRLVTADFDKDGDLDVILASSTNATDDLHRYFGLQSNSAFTVSSPSTIPWGRKQPGGIGVGDFNCDGRLDYAISGKNDTLVGIFLQNADTTYSLSVELVPTDKPRLIQIADINRDGKLDLIISVPSASPDAIDIFLGNGSGGFPTKVTASALGDQGLTDFAVGDINNDGRLDVVATEPLNDTFQIFRGSASTLDNALVGDRITTGKTPGKVRLGDFNRDGRLDVLVVSEEDKEIWFHPGNGDFTFGAAVQVTLSGSIDTPGGLAVGDLDRDGDLDAVVLSKTAAFIQVLEWTGAGFSAGTPFATFTAASEIELADLDQDGDLEIVTGDKEIVIHENQGGLAFGAANTQALNAGKKLSQIAIADMNRDGDLDVIVSIDNNVGEAQLLLGQ